MISRRLLRIKILHILYAYFSNSDPSINKFEKDLFFSIDKSYDLYHYLLLLLVEVKKEAEEKTDLAKQKRIPTNEDLNPNTKFIDNRIINSIWNNNSFTNYLTKNKINWVDNPELSKRLFRDFQKTELYQTYMNSEGSSFNEDKKLVIAFFEEIIATNDFLYQLLEEKSIFWNDDVEFIISMVIKTIQKMKPTQGQHTSLLPLFKNEDDHLFTKFLFRKSVLNHNEYRELIEKHLKNWDIDRIAFIDIVIMIMAIAEVIEFPSIPIKVTMNEYIELAKFYSTNKSNIFVNGILDKIFAELKEQNKIQKTGRGLIDK
jgi:transcription antitermination protein NusB